MCNECLLAYKNSQKEETVVQSLMTTKSFYTVLSVQCTCNPYKVHTIAMYKCADLTTTVYVYTDKNQIINNVHNSVQLMKK